MGTPGIAPALASMPAGLVANDTQDRLGASASKRRSTTLGAAIRMPIEHMGDELSLRVYPEQSVRAASEHFAAPSPPCRLAA